MFELAGVYSGATQYNDPVFTCVIDMSVSFASPKPETGTHAEVAVPAGGDDILKATLTRRV